MISSGGQYEIFGFLSSYLVIRDLNAHDVNFIGREEIIVDRSLSK